MDRASATPAEKWQILTMKKPDPSIPFLRNQPLPVTNQEITGKHTANLIVYTIAFSRHKPFSLGSHLLVLLTMMS